MIIDSSLERFQTKTLCLSRTRTLIVTLFLHQGPYAVSTVDLLRFKSFQGVQTQMSDGLDLQISSTRLCSCLSTTIKNTEAFDFSNSSITHLALYALFLLLAPLHPGWNQYNRGAGCSGCVLNLCIFTPFSLAARKEIAAKCFSHCILIERGSFKFYILIGSVNRGLK